MDAAGIGGGVVTVMNLADALGWVAAGLLIVAFLLQITNTIEARVGYALFAVAFGLGFLANVLDFSRGWAVYDGLMAVLYTWLWWRNRRNGRWRKAARELGAKSKARVEALARQMTPSPIPNPVGVS